MSGVGSWAEGGKRERRGDGPRIGTVAARCGAVLATSDVLLLIWNPNGWVGDAYWVIGLHRAKPSDEADFNGTPLTPTGIVP